MITKRALEELSEFDTALLANSITQMRNASIADFYLSGSIQSVTPALGPTVGIAFTCELDSSSLNNVASTDLYWEQLDEIARYSLPTVWVVKAVGSRPDHECVLGDGMAKSLHSVGCVGLVSDGRVRDVAGLQSTPFAAYCRGKAIHHSPLQFRAINRPIEVGGVLINPGDVIHASSEGVIRIPPQCLTGLAETAVRMCAFERHAHMLLRRTDLSPREKRDLIKILNTEYGFSDCVTLPSDDGDVGVDASISTDISS